MCIPHSFNAFISLHTGDEFFVIVSFSVCSFDGTHEEHKQSSSSSEEENHMNQMDSINTLLHWRTEKK